MSQPFGNLQKGCIDIVGCTVVHQNWVRGRDHVFRVVSPTQTTPIEISAQSEEEMVEWISKIRETSQLFNDKIKQNQEMEKNFRIAQELSNLIIYCRAVQFAAESQLFSQKSNNFIKYFFFRRNRKFHRNVFFS